MIALTTSEIRKSFSVRAPYSMGAGATLLVAMATASQLLSVEPEKLSGAVHEQTFYHLAAIVLAVFSSIIGVRAFADEFRHGTVVSLFLSQPSKAGILVAKAVAAGMVGASIAVVGLASMTLIALSIAGAKGGSLTFGTADLAAFSGLVLGMVGWAAIGTAVGALMRHQVASIVGILVWVLVFESTSSGFLGGISRFLPGQTVLSIADVNQETVLLSLGVAATLLVLYTLVLSVAAVFTLDRRDVL